MAEVLLSPGVLAQENDQSFLQAQPIQAGAAILGPTVKGPVGLPTLVTTYSEYKNKFGCVVESGSAEYTYFTSIAAYNYFQQGGDSLLVTRVVSGSYTPATSSDVSNSNIAVAGATASATYTYDLSASDPNKKGIGLNLGPTTPLFLTSSANNTLPGLDLNFFVGGPAGLIDSINDNYGSIVSASYDAVTEVVTLEAVTPGTTPNPAPGGQGWNIIQGGLYQLYAGSGAVVGTFTGGTVSTFNNSFTLETISEGVGQNSSGSEGVSGDLANGTTDNIRWEIVSPNTASGTFSLLIRRGDDITTSKTVLETWANISLDPNASNYIEKVIGNSVQTVQEDPGTGEYYVENTGTYNTLSNYVRVKSVESPTLNYFDNAGNPKSQYTSSIPIAASGTFGDAEGTPFNGVVANFYENIDGSNTQGLVPDNYSTSLSLLANQDDYRYNLIVAPGLTLQSHSSPISAMVDNAQQRGDNLAVVDLRDWGSQINPVVNGAAAIDSSYAATYWPWV